MGEWYKLFETSFSHKLILIIPALGWLLSIICIISKFDPEKDKKTCLANDVIKSTFITLTLVFTISIALSFTIYLKDVSLVSGVEDCNKKISSCQDILGQKNQEIIRLNDIIAGLKKWPSQTLSDVLLELEKNNLLNRVPVIDAVDRYIGNNIHSVSIYTKNHEVIVSNTGDGIFDFIKR